MSLAAVFEAKERFNNLSIVTNSLGSSVKNHSDDLRLLRDQLATLSLNQTSLHQSIASLNLELVAVRTGLATQTALADTLVSNKRMTDFEAKIRTEMTEEDTKLRSRIQNLERANTLLAKRVKDLEANQEELMQTVKKLNDIVMSMSESAHAVNKLVLSQHGNSDKLDAILTHLQIPTPTLTTVGLTMPLHSKADPTYIANAPFALVAQAE